MELRSGLQIGSMTAPVSVLSAMMHIAFSNTTTQSPTPASQRWPFMLLTQAARTMCWNPRLLWIQMIRGVFRGSPLTPADSGWAAGIVTGGNGQGYVPVIDAQGIKHLTAFISNSMNDPPLFPLYENGFLDITQDPNGNVITPQVTYTGGSFNVTGWVDTIGRFIPAPRQPLNVYGSPASYCET